MLRWFMKYWLRWRVAWSNWRFHNDGGDLVDYPVVDVPHNLLEVRDEAKKLWEHFQYTYDDATQLFDAMRSPATCYAEYKQGMLRDDCDGFHAALYHMVHRGGKECFLITYVPNPWWEAHTILAIKFLSGWVVCDYDRVSGFEENLETLIKRCAERYGTNTENLLWNAVQYNYVKGRWEVKEI